VEYVVDVIDTPPKSFWVSEGGFFFGKKVERKWDGLVRLFFEKKMADRK
jgi:hypothetical protein